MTGSALVRSALSSSEASVTAMFQAADINALFGFRIECIERLGERNGLWAWTRLNSLFNWLPLAACIEDKVLCMHGGERYAFLAAHDPPTLSASVV